MSIIAAVAGGVAAVSLVTSLVGSAMRAKSEAERARALAQLEELYKFGGAEIRGIVESELAKAQADPESISAQHAALEQLSELSRPGMTAETAALQEQIAARQRADEASQRAAIQQQALARGMLGSGQALALQQAAQQGAAGRASQRGIDIQALAEQRALEALAQRSNLATQMRGQSFQEAAQRGAAEDLRQQFNRQLQQQSFQNKLAQRQAIAGARAAGITGKYQASAYPAQVLGGLGQTGFQAATALGQYALLPSGGQQQQPQTTEPRFHSGGNLYNPWHRG